MANNIALQCVMSANDCLQVFRVPRSDDFGSVIVYLPRYRRHDGGHTCEKGMFQEFDLKVTAMETGLDDWHLDADCLVNNHGTEYKRVYVTYDHVEYYKAFFYGRIRKRCQYSNVIDVLAQLNGHLDMYVDHLRTGIAQEWAAQEIYRVLPRFESACITPVRGADGRVSRYNFPGFDIRQTMVYHLPRGYDDERSANHVV